MDLRRFGVDEQRHPHHDRAQVEGPGRGGGDDRQGERRALVGAGEEGLAFDRERRGAGAGARPWRRRPGSWPGSSSLPPRRRRAGGGRGDRARRAVGDAGELAGQPRRQADVDALQLLLAVGAGDVEREGAVGAGLDAVRAGSRSPARRAVAAIVFAQLPPPGAVLSVKLVARRRGGVAGPGGDRRASVVFGPQVGGLVSAAFGAAVELELEGGEGQLRVFGEGRGQPAGRAGWR